VRTAVEAWARGERDLARAAYDPHVVFIIPVLDVPVSYGLDETERALESWRRTFDEWRVEMDETIDGGDQVVLIQRQFGTGKESGVPVEFPSAGVYTLRGGKIVRVEYFLTREEALEAAGLSK
jgi:ketosteroid isomerase-like protein